MALVRELNDDRIVLIAADSGTEVFSITETQTERGFRLALVGEMTSEAALEFEAEVMAALSFCKTILLDFSGLRYISAAGLAKLLLAYQQAEDAHCTLMLYGVIEEVQVALEDSGLNDLFDIDYLTED